LGHRAAAPGACFTAFAQFIDFGAYQNPGFYSDVS
jgi:hypothetical protein